MKEGSRPSTVNGKVPPRRLLNAERRPREYLTPEEAERLITTAQKRIGTRNPHRDATMILLAYRHGLRASEVCALRWDMLDLAKAASTSPAARTDGRACIFCAGRRSARSGA